MRLQSKLVYIHTREAWNLDAIGGRLSCRPLRIVTQPGPEADSSLLVSSHHRATPASVSFGRRSTRAVMPSASEPAASIKSRSVSAVSPGDGKTPAAGSGFTIEAGSPGLARRQTGPGSPAARAEPSAADLPSRGCAGERGHPRTSAAGA